jgi:hypothetical protein
VCDDLKDFIAFLESLIIGSSYIQISRIRPMDMTKYDHSKMSIGGTSHIKSISNIAETIITTGRAWKSYPLLLRLGVSPFSIFFLSVFFEKKK